MSSLLILISLLLQAVILNLNSVVLNLNQFSKDFAEIKESCPTSTLAKKLLTQFNSLASRAPSYYASNHHFTNLVALKPKAQELINGIKVCMEQVSTSPVGARLGWLIDQVEESMRFMSVPVEDSTTVTAGVEATDCIERTVFKTLLGVQSLLKGMKGFKEEETWLTVMNVVVQNFPKVKCIGLLQDMEKIHKIVGLLPEAKESMFAQLSDAVKMLDVYRSALRKVINKIRSISR